MTKTKSQSRSLQLQARANVINLILSTHGYNQDDFGKLCGVTQQFVSYWIMGNRKSARLDMIFEQTFNITPPPIPGIGRE